MATTTSVQDSGLLDFLIPAFTKDTGITMKWVSVGTGKALAHARNCDVDVVLVHAPEAEKDFISGGYALQRYPIMYNTFLIVGPKADTAKVLGQDAIFALQNIARNQALFVSRGDDSGTHKTEEKLWRSAKLNIPQREKWYFSAGQGMMHTLNIASEKEAYTLSDSGTWLQFKSKNPQSPLQILVQDDENLFNQYSVLELNSQKCSSIKKELAQQFITWITSPKAQERIAAYHINNKQLFFPNAGVK